MKILFIAPLPPPTHGMSLASDVLLKRLVVDHEVRVVDMAKKKRTTNAWEMIKRGFEVIGFFWATFRKKRNVDLIYLTISESSAGNIKDLVIYVLCFRKLDKMIIHMLGGAGMRTILEKNGIQYRLNKFFVSRMKGVVVEGQRQVDTFSKLIDKRKIRIVPNFAEDFLFVDEATVRAKFVDLQPIKILFLSNLIYGKGHQELAEAYISLSDEMKKKITIVFVGGFQSPKHEQEFLEKIAEFPGLTYHGKFISGEPKKNLYCDSHVFCLPTYYPYEGQPISILEAYATGCVVVTTEHSGIPDVFSHQVNGLAVEKKSLSSIKKVMEELVERKESLVNYAITNRSIAYEKYRTSIYGSNLLSIITASGKGAMPSP